MIDKPSDKEDEYFLRREIEAAKRSKLEVAREMEAEEKSRLKELHWMRCPKCGQELSEIKFRDVEVDACFSCGGMFFDKGEVEKVTEAEDSGFLGKVTSTLFGK
jgi:hypothetical protein